MVAPRIARRDASSGRVRSRRRRPAREKHATKRLPERRRVFVRVFSRVVLVGVVAVARSGVRARAGASSRAKLRVQGVARARLADATKYDVGPTQYCPVGGLPAVYHSEMVDMVRRRERSDEVAEARRKVGLARERARRLEANRATRAERERRQVAAGQMIAGFPSEFEENRREGAVVGPNGDVVNLPRRPGPERDVALAARRAPLSRTTRRSRRRDVANDARTCTRVRARHENAKRAHRAPRRRRADVPDQQGVRQDGGGGRWRRVHVVIGR